MSWGEIGGLYGARMMPKIINTLMAGDGKSKTPHPDVVGTGLEAAGTLAGAAAGGPVGAAVGGTVANAAKPFLSQGGLGEDIAGLGGAVLGALTGGLADPEQERQRANMQIQMPQRQRPGLMQTRITGEV